MNRFDGAPWFRSRSGLSWQPVTWQGWAVTVLFVIVAGVTHSVLGSSTIGMALIVAYVAMLIWVIWLTGRRASG